MRKNAKGIDCFMDVSIGGTLAQLRQSQNYTQKALAEKLSDYGFRVNAKTIYNWEKGLAQPNIRQFLTLCDILGVDDVLWRFLGLHRGVYAGLNEAGREKARELISLLFQIDKYRVAPEQNSGAPRLVRLYDMSVSSGAASFPEESSYSMIEVPGYVDERASFALRVGGDSMEPLLRNGQIIWVWEKDTLNNGEIGVFRYSDVIYCKRFIKAPHGIVLKSLNPNHDDIEVNESFGFKIIGKVVA